MSKYIGAKYIGLDPFLIFDGSLISNGEITELLSEEAAINDINFEPVYRGSVFRTKTSEDNDNRKHKHKKFHKRR